jgi:uncharacterized membrane protein YobD (UPF0266 family)
LASPSAFFFSNAILPYSKSSNLNLKNEVNLVFSITKIQNELREIAKNLRLVQRLQKNRSI